MYSTITISCVKIMQTDYLYNFNSIDKSICYITILSIQTNTIPSFQGVMLLIQMCMHSILNTKPTFMKIMIYCVKGNYARLYG